MRSLSAILRNATCVAVLVLASTPFVQPAHAAGEVNIYSYREPGLIQAGTLMTLIIPVVAFLLTQRFFTRGIVITGVDK